MSRRVSRPAAALLALILTLSAPSAFASMRNRGDDPDLGTRIVRFIKHFAKKLGITTTTEDIVFPFPPIP